MCYELHERPDDNFELYGLAETTVKSIARFIQMVWV